ncbi:MAG: YfdX family protein [Chromatiaceae bacterium]|nr:YfdX family protein [Chromatiaceae bacterium]
MNRITKSRFTAVLLTTGLGLAGAYAGATDVRAPAYYETPPPAPALSVPPAKDFASNAGTAVSEQDVAGVKTIESEQPVEGIDSETLGKARALYKNLLLALRAAEQHDNIDMRLGLNNANRIVDSLYTSSALQALMQQSAIIREDLKRSGKTLDKGLWLPLQAELETFRVALPVKRYQATKSAIDKGVAAAQAGDKSKVRAALDTIEQSVVRHFTLLPLATIRADLRAADDAVDPAPPYWPGVHEALRSALASIRWVTTVGANDWISAYTDAVKAIKTAPENPDQARGWLRSVAARLQGLSGAGDLANTARGLSISDPLSPDALYDLVDAIGAHVSAAGSP